MSSPRLLSSLIILQMFYAQIVMGNKSKSYTKMSTEQVYQMVLLTYYNYSVCWVILCFNFCIAIVANYSSLIPGFSSCHFEGYKYKINERFHPKAVFDGKVYEEICVDCKCNPVSAIIIKLLYSFDCKICIFE